MNRFAFFFFNKENNVHFNLNLEFFSYPYSFIIRKYIWKCVSRFFVTMGNRAIETGLLLNKYDLQFF